MILSLGPEIRSMQQWKAKSVDVRTSEIKKNPENATTTVAVETRVRPSPFCETR